ncbi:TatD family hydrolase [Marinomonas dokdonensis]|uniref:TatD family hydrolase n=1 Tax=Marinomonas dokdonensis TaxID=328224 RepID=UPI00405551B9
MYIDSHCHLDFSVFDSQRQVLMQQCQDQHITGFLVPATTHASWKPLAQLAQEFPQWRTAYGLHPYFLAAAKKSEVAQLGEWCEKHESLAVGEIGLDNWPGSVDMAVQIDFFKAQLNVAKAIKRPVILHARKSYDLVLKSLRETAFEHGGIVHAFNGSLVQAKRFIDFGFVLGMGGTITYPRAQKAIRVLASLKDNDFVLETDSPDMPLHGFQGQNNTPLAIPLIAEQVAQVRGQTKESVAHYTYNNLLRVFPQWHKDSH